MLPALYTILGRGTPRGRASTAQGLFGAMSTLGLIVASVVASQVQLHSATGGIVPEVAARAHLRWMIPVLDEARDRAGIDDWREVDAVAVTEGPGLAGSLLVGITMAKTLAWSMGLPLVPVNHLEGHIYAAWLLDPESDNYHVGYCENFATAMAVMARTLDIPSRVVLGSGVTWTNWEQQGGQNQVNAAADVSGSVALVAGDRQNDGVFPLWSITKNISIGALRELVRGRLVDAAAEAGAKLEPFEYDPGELKAGEVEIDVQACGICHSDAFVKFAAFPGLTLPRVPGHEVRV